MPDCSRMVASSSEECTGELMANSQGDTGAAHYGYVDEFEAYSSLQCSGCPVRGRQVRRRTYLRFSVGGQKLHSEPEKWSVAVYPMNKI
jgi:hypothetical protein